MSPVNTIVFDLLLHYLELKLNMFSDLRLPVFLDRPYINFFRSSLSVSPISSELFISSLSFAFENWRWIGNQFPVYSFDWEEKRV